MSTPDDQPTQWGGGATAAPPKPRNGLGTAALILGILALLTCWLPVVGFVLGLLAVILGVVGRGRVRKMQATNGGVALTGLILGLLSLLVNVLITAAFLVFGFAFVNLGGGATFEQYQQCLAAAPNAGNPALVQQALEQCNQQFTQQLPNLGDGEGEG